MNDYDFLWNGQHTRCAETVITVNGDGEVTSSCNPKYVASDHQFNICKCLGIIENSTDQTLVEKAKYILREYNARGLKARASA